MSALLANEFDHKTATDQFNAYARCKSLEECAHSIQRDGLPYSYKHKKGAVQKQLRTEEMNVGSKRVSRAFYSSDMFLTASFEAAVSSSHLCMNVCEAGWLQAQVCASLRSCRSKY